MDKLVRAREEIRNGNCNLAEVILASILDSAEGISAHLLFDLVSAYDELFTPAGRYEDLVSISRRCFDKAEVMQGIDREINSAHILIVVAGAEKALGRKHEAERDAVKAERLLNRFCADRFGVGSRVRVNKIRVRLKLLQRALNQDAPASSSTIQSGGPNSNPNAGPEEWQAFASRKNHSRRDVKAWLAGMRRSAGLAKSLAILLDWAAQTPRAGNIGTSVECFAAFIEELTSITNSHAVALDSLSKLFQVLHGWEQEDGSWLQRLIQTNRKVGLTEELHRLRRATDIKIQHLSNSLEKHVTALEILDNYAIPDEGMEQDQELILLRLDSDLEQLSSFVPSPLSSRLHSLRDRATSAMARIHRELRRRNEEYAQILEASGHASSQSALAELRTTAEYQLTPAMLARQELQQVFHDAEVRLAAELEAMEIRGREAHRARLDSVRGVDLANLLFKEYGVDLPTARKLVIDRNHGDLSREGFVDRVLEIRQQKQKPTES